ncbi:MAG: hypothetical protein KGV58_01505 [Campylobacteraceae bacterium]|nr:hypothetical protein [Campylobacteraceae bacterium]
MNNFGMRLGATLFVLHVKSKKLSKKYITCKNQSLFASLFKFCFFQNDQKLQLFERKRVL